MARLSARAALMLAATLPAAAAFNTIPAGSPLVRWVGRRAPVGASSGPVYFDWEGVSATVTVTNYSFVAAQISDNCPGSASGGGSRWLVRMTTGVPGTAPPGHRVSTFVSGALQPLYYLFNDPSKSCDPSTPACSLAGNASFELVRLTEGRVSGCGPSGNLSVTGFVSDGTFLPPPQYSNRRLEFIGDSISAGDLNSASFGVLNPTVPVCGNAAWNNDITVTSGGILCTPEALGGLGADCHFTAWGGITLGVPPRWGMTQLYPYTFTSTGGDSAYQPWVFGADFAPNGVVINLGTNDHPTPPALDWQAAYVSFAQSIVSRYYNDSSLQLFLAYGPMSAAYQPLVENITTTLVAAGYRAATLDLTLNHSLTGCYGHPSWADNLEIAAKARPQIAAVMGWD